MIKGIHPVVVIDAALRKILLEILDSHIELFLCRTILSILLKLIDCNLAEKLCRLRICREEYMDIDSSKRFSASLKCSAYSVCATLLLTDLLRVDHVEDVVCGIKSYVSLDVNREVCSV